jgi:hypothetical protein
MPTAALGPRSIKTGFATGRNRLSDGARRGRIEIDHLERVVAVAGIEPSAVDTTPSGPEVVHRAGGGELNSHEAADGPLEPRCWVSMISMPAFDRSEDQRESIPRGSG